MKSLEGIKILLVDDEADLREAIRFDLDRAGAEVVEADGGRRALERARAQNFDVVVSDLRMPGGNGIELLDGIMALLPPRPVLIFMTGFTDISLRETYHRGASAIISKPFRSAHLLHAVTRTSQAVEKSWQAPLTGPHPSREVALELPQGDQKFLAEAFEIARGGMFIRAEQDRPRVNEVIRFKLVQARDKVVKVEGLGLVRWSEQGSTGHEQPGYGIEFFGLDLNSATYLLQLLSSKKDQTSFIPGG